jgi:hypothetical protein
MNRHQNRRENFARLTLEDANAIDRGDPIGARRHLKHDNAAAAVVGAERYTCRLLRDAALHARLPRSFGVLGYAGQKERPRR